MFFFRVISKWKFKDDDFREIIVFRATWGWGAFALLEVPCVGLEEIGDWNLHSINPLPTDSTLMYRCINLLLITFYIELFEALIKSILKYLIWPLSYCVITFWNIYFGLIHLFLLLWSNYLADTKWNEVKGLLSVRSCTQCAVIIEI